MKYFIVSNNCIFRRDLKDFYHYSSDLSWCKCIRASEYFLELRYALDLKSFLNKKIELKKISK